MFISDKGGMKEFSLASVKAYGMGIHSQLRETFFMLYNYLHIHTAFCNPFIIMFFFPIFYIPNFYAIIHIFFL